MRQTSPTTSQYKGIQRIILVDSYLQGVRTEVEIDGHTGITGENGTGKTSLLRLVPIFFGAEPRSIIRTGHRGGTVPFVRWYLPRTASCVVFEYVTHRGPQMVVLLPRPGQDQCRHLLISGGYDEQLFLDAERNFLPSEELHKRARAAGRFVYPCDSIKHYREIVFGDARERGRGEEAQRFNLLLGSSEANRSSLQNAHTLVTATLESSVDERSLRKMLYEQALRNCGHTSDDKLAALNLDTEDLAAWLGNHAGLMELSRRRPEAHQAITQARELCDLAAEEALLRAAMHARQEQLTRAVQTAEETIGLQEQEKKRLDKDYQGKKDADRTRRRDATRRKDEAENAIESIQSRIKQMRDSGIDAALAIAAEFDQRRERRDQADHRLRTLRAQSQNIDEEIDREIESVRADCETRREAIAKRREKWFQDEADRRESLRTEHDQAIQTLESRIEDEQTALDQRKAEFQQAYEQAKAEHAWVTASQDVIDHLESQRQALETVTKELRDAEAAYRDAERERDRGLAELHKLESEEQAERQRLVEAQRREEALAEQLERRGTLLEFVRENTPGQVGPLAAVLSRGTDLLYDKRLKPSLADSPEASLLGVAIDLDELPTVDIDRELRDELAAIREAMPASQKTVHDIERRLKEARTNQAKYNKKLTVASESFATLKSRHSSIDEAVRAARDAYDRSLEANRAQAQEALDQAGQALEKVRKEIAIRLEDQSNRKQELRENHREQIKALESEIKRGYEALRNEDGNAVQLRDDSIGEWEKLRAQRYSDSGIDKEVLAQAQKTLTECEAAFDEARKAARTTEAWHDLNNEAEQRLPTLREQSSDAVRDISALDEQWRAFEADYNRQAAQCEEVRNKAEQERAGKRSEILVLAPILDAPATLALDQGNLDQATIEARAMLSAQELSGKIESIHRQAKELRATLTQQLNQFERFFRRTPSRFIRDLVENQSYATHAGSQAIAEQMSAAQALELIYGTPSDWDQTSDAFPAETEGERLEDVVRGFVVNRFEVDGFVRALESISREVSRAGARIQEHFQDFVSDIDSLQSITIDAAFDCSKIDGYDAARRLSDSIEAFEMRRGNQGDPRLIPDEAMARAVSDILEYLECRSDKNKVGLWESVEMAFTVETTLPADVPKRCAHGQSLRSAFSTGIGLMVITAVLVGFLENLRNRMPIAVTLMVDELLTLDEGNASGLLEALERRGIYLVTTSPDIKSELDPCFSRRYALQTTDQEGNRLPVPVFIRLEPKGELDDPFAA